MPFHPHSTRRQLLLFGAAIAAVFSRAIGARGQHTPNASSLFAQANGFVPVNGSPGQLQKDGKILTDTVLIVRNSATKQLVAVSPACTHRRCVVDWQQETQGFICNCHGARFNTDGKATKGPAQRPLRSFDVKLENNRFFIRPR